MLSQADDLSFEKEVLEHAGTVLVDFYTPTCNLCRQLEPQLRSLANQSPGIKFVKIDVTKARKVAEYFGIISSPVMIVFKNGEIASRINGKPPASRLRQMVQEI